MIHKLFRTAPGWKVAFYTDQQYLWEESGLCLKLNLFIKYNSSNLVGYVNATRCSKSEDFGYFCSNSIFRKQLGEIAGVRRELKCNIALWIFLWTGNVAGSDFFFPSKSLSRWKQHKHGCDLLFKAKFFWLLRQSRNSHSFPKMWKSDTRNGENRQHSSWCTAVTSAYCIKSRGNGFHFCLLHFVLPFYKKLQPPMSNSSLIAVFEENVWSAFPVQTPPMLFHLV